jgi:hypothetical protein
MQGFFYPHLRVPSVRELGPERLAGLGLDALLLDVDCTLKRYRESRCNADVVAWIESLREAGIGLCLVSNGRGRRIAAVAEHLNLPFVATAMKPLPFRIRSVVRKMGFQPKRTAMVGDQLFADILAGRLAGLWTILVEPIHPEDEPWFTQLKRRPERALLRRLDKITQQPPIPNP